ncbi:MAG TPA: helix-turn-helix transcriptional regulator [Anaerolineaceae bacterium]|nr:helix-turn-helix transcriptional regulator [Anaerolineaceae bacterium]
MMFDTQKTGLKIMTLRKAKDMTQMELADLMQVSYQAVSNWERGNSMPDISKLVDLARILDVSIEELLDSRQQAQTVKRALDENETLTAKEITEVAPLLKPSKLEKELEKAPIEGLELKDLQQLAPFLSEEKLMELVERVGFNHVSDLVPVAPFMNSKQLQTIIIQQGELHENLDDIISIVPFLEENFVADIAKNLIADDDDASLLLPLVPFLDTDTLMDLIEEAEPENMNDILPFMPFLKSEEIMRLLAKLSKSLRMDDLSKIAPFLDEDALSQLVDKAIDSGEKAQDIENIVTHLNPKTVKKYAGKLIEKGDIKTLKSILPFLEDDED